MAKKKIVPVEIVEKPKYFIFMDSASASDSLLIKELAKNGQEPTFNLMNASTKYLLCTHTAHFEMLPEYMLNLLKKEKHNIVLVIQLSSFEINKFGSDGKMATAIFELEISMSYPVRAIKRIAPQSTVSCMYFNTTDKTLNSINLD